MHAREVAAWWPCGAAAGGWRAFCCCRFGGAIAVWSAWISLFCTFPWVEWLFRLVLSAIVVGPDDPPQPPLPGEKKRPRRLGGHPPGLSLGVSSTIAGVISAWCRSGRRRAGARTSCCPSGINDATLYWHHHAMAEANRRVVTIFLASSYAGTTGVRQPISRLR